MFVKINKIRALQLNQRGFSLAEVLAALMIGSMVIVGVLSIYMRADESSRAVLNRLESPRMASEVLQRIAEDLDSIISAGSDTKITIPGSKIMNGYTGSRLEILRTFYDRSNKAQKFEEIIWQSYPDDEGNGLILYRSHSGKAGEDKLLDRQKEEWEKEMFVPICNGVTLFMIEIPRQDEFLDKWTEASLPAGIVVTLSFGVPYKTVGGELEVDEIDKVSRTIAIDRTRKIKYHLAPIREGIDVNETKEEIIEDPNSLKDPNAIKPRL